MPIRGLEELDGRFLDGLAFCRIAYDIFDRVRAAPAGVEELRMLRSVRSKKLIEEVLPVARFVQARYRPGLRIHVRWKGGNQTHDAFLRFSGPAVDHQKVPTRQFLEVSTAVHPNEYLSREQLNREGMSWGPGLARRDRNTGLAASEPYVRDYREPEREHVAQILDVIRDKQAKRYPAATTLLIRVVVNAPMLDDEWAFIVAEVGKHCGSLRFREVILIEPVSDRFTPAFLRSARARQRLRKHLRSSAPRGMMGHRDRRS